MKHAWRVSSDLTRTFKDCHIHVSLLLTHEYTPTVFTCKNQFYANLVISCFYVRTTHLQLSGSPPKLRISRGEVDVITSNVSWSPP